METHSPIGASSAYRWMPCPGSVELSKGIESKSSEYAEEGTDAHALGEKFLLARSRDVQSWLDKVIPGSKTNRKASQDMIDAVQEYVDYVLDFVDGPEACEIHIEHKFHLKHLMDDLYGTNDVNVATKDVLRVIDYKHGKGVAVEVVENPQLMYYALGAIHEHPKIEMVELVIVQPRAPHADGAIRTWWLTREELVKWGTDVLIPSAKATKVKGAKIEAGKWCRFCPAMPVCPEMAQKAIEMAQQDFTVIEDPKTIVMPEPEQLSMEQILKILEFGPVLESYAKEVKNYVHGLLENGKDVPGYKLVAKRSNRAWDDARDQEALTNKIKEHAEKKGKDVAAVMYTEPKLRSPAQMEKDLGAAFKREIEEFWNKPDNGTTIAPEGDKRAAAPRSAAVDFLPLADVFK